MNAPKGVEAILNKSDRYFLYIYNIRSKQMKNQMVYKYYKYYHYFDIYPIIRRYFITTRKLLHVFSVQNSNQAFLLFSVFLLSFFALRCLIELYPCLLSAGRIVCRGTQQWSSVVTLTRLLYLHCTSYWQLIITHNTDQFEQCYLNRSPSLSHTWARLFFRSSTLNVVSSLGLSLDDA